MPVKDILIHMDHSRSCHERMRVAIEIATRHGAHLTALYVTSRPILPGYIEAQLSQDVLDGQIDAMNDAAREVQVMFEDACRFAKLPFEWRTVEGDMVDTLVTHSRYFDLCIVGQRDPDDLEAPGSSELPDQLLLRSGRPVLVIPYVGTYKTVGDHVMTAWDGSRLATRAVGDAMDFLEAAKKVEVLVVDAKGKGNSNGHHSLPGADICLHLARHNINAEAQHLSSGGLSAGDTLLSYAADNGIDLIVMGGYGHHRWREVVLGGVTRHMLQHMTVPVFMTH